MLASHQKRPVVVMVKIGDLEVLTKLIKDYGESGQTIAHQLRAAEILASMRSVKAALSRVNCRGIQRH